MYTGYKYAYKLHMKYCS